MSLPRCKNGPYGGICFQDKLEAEIERLRAALTTIADHKDTMSDFPHTTWAMQDFARNALNSDSH